MSPILVRPVREQLEHDRIIRLLQVKCRRRYDVGMNPGAEQNAAVGTGPTAIYPDLVLTSQDRGHRLQAVVEVETGESVNHLEALAQWAQYGRLRAAFHLYVPAGMVDVAKRLSEENQVQISEVWSYHTIGDQVRFTLVHRSREVPVSASRARATARAASPRRKPAAKPPRKAARSRPRAAARVKRAAKKPAASKKRR